MYDISGKAKKHGPTVTSFMVGRCRKMENDHGKAYLCRVKKHEYPDKTIQEKVYKTVLKTEKSTYSKYYWGNNHLSG